MSGERKGTLLCILAAVCWGLVSNAGEYLIGIKGMNAIQVTSLRLMTAGLILLAIASIQGHKIFDVWRDRQDVINLLITGFIGFGVCQTAYFISIQHANGGTASVLQNTAPIIILGYTLLHEKRAPKLWELFSILLVLFGAFMLATHGDIHSLAISALSLFTGLLSASAVALYSIFPANLMKKHGALIITGWGLLLGGLMLTPAAKPWPLTGQIDTGCILMFTFLVLAGTVSTFALYMYSLPLIGAVKASVICLLEPVVATFVTVTVFHTAFTISDYIGILTILTGVLVLTLTPESTLK